MNIDIIGLQNMSKINGTEKNSSKEKSEKNRAPSKSERIKLLEETIENVLNNFQTLKEEKDQLKNFVITLENRVLTLEQENIQLKKQAKKPEKNYASPSSSKNFGPSNVATASIPTYQDFVRRPSANAEAESYNSRLAKKRRRRKSEQTVYDVSKDGHECTLCHKYIKTRVNEHVRIHTSYLLRCPENCGTKERNLKDMIEHLEESHNMSNEVATDEAFAVMVQICFPNFPLSLPKATTSRPRTPRRSPTPVRPIISKPRCTATPTSSTAGIQATTLTSNPGIHIYNINLYNQNPDQQQDQSMSDLLRNFDEDGVSAAKSPTQSIVTIDSDDEEKEMVSEATNDSTNVEMKRTIGQNVEANQQNTREAMIIEINQTNIEVSQQNYVQNEKNYPEPMDVDENIHEIASRNQVSATLIHEVSEPFSWDDGNTKEVAPQNFQTLKELFNSGRIDQVNSSLSSAQNSRIFSENSTNPSTSQNPPSAQSSPTKLLPHKNKKHRERDDFATSVQYGIKNFENRQEKLNKKICESSSSSDDEEVEEELRRIEMKQKPAEELDLNHMEPEESPNELEKSLVEDDVIEKLENEHGLNPSSRSSTPDDQEHRFVRIDHGNEGDDLILNSESTETTILQAPESQFEEENLENPNDSMIHERINTLKQEQAISNELEPEEVTIQDEEEILNEEEKRRLSYLTEVDHLINSKNKFMNNSTEEPLNEYESGRTTPEIEESHQSSSSRQILQNPSISVRNEFAPSPEPVSLHETRQEDKRRLSRGREIEKPKSSKPTDQDIQKALLAKYVRQCRFYNLRTRTGCRDGEKCRFTHGTQMTNGLRDAVDIMNGVKSARKPPPRRAQRSRSRPRRNSPVRTNRSRSRGRPYSKTRRRSRSRSRSCSRSRSSRPRLSNQHRNRTRGGRREMRSGKSRSRSRSISKPRNSRDLTKSRSNSPRSRSPKRSRRANRPFTTRSRSRSQEKSEIQDKNLQISSISSTTRSHPTTPNQVPVITTQPQKQNDTTIIYAETGRTTPAPTHNTASPENSWPNLSFGAAFGGFVPYKKKSEDATTSNQKIQEYTYDEVKLLIRKAGLFECDYFTRTRRCNYRDNCFKVHWAKENGFFRTEGTLQLQRYLQERLF